MDYEKLRDEDQDKVKEVVEFLQNNSLAVELKGSATKGDKMYHDVDLLATGDHNDVFRAMKRIIPYTTMTPVDGPKTDLLQIGNTFYGVRTQGSQSYVGTFVDTRVFLDNGDLSIDLSFKAKPSQLENML